MTAQSLAPRPTALRGLLVVLAATVLAIAGALPAFAHASLVRTSPEAGSTLTAAPPEVALTFNEEINPQFTTVSVKTGDTTASTGDAEVDGTTVYQALDPEMPAGTYTVAYRVTSADGHPVSGSFDFTYAPGGGEGAGETEGTPSPTSATPSGTAAPTPTETSEPADETGTSTPADTSGSETTTSPDTTDETTTSTSTTTTDEATPAATDDDGGVPWWVWALGALVVIGLVGGIVLVLGRRGDEDVDLHSYGHPHDGDGELR